MMIIRVRRPRPTRPMDQTCLRYRHRDPPGPHRQSHKVPVDNCQTGRHIPTIGQQTGSWTGHTVQKWNANLHRHVPGKLTSFSETTTNPLGGSYTIQYSGITATKGPQEDSLQTRNLGRSLPADTIPASEIAAIIWATQPFHILQTFLTSNGWQMAKFFKQVADTPEETLLGIDCKHAPTTCTCFLTQNAHICTITRATCTLENPEYQRRLQQHATNTHSTASDQDCPEKPFLCICREPFPTAFALNLHIAGAPAGDTIGHRNHAQDSDSTPSYLTLTTRTPLKEWSWHSRKECTCRSTQLLRYVPALTFCRTHKTVRILGDSGFTARQP
jgi:hypothetical protein